MKKWIILVTLIAGLTLSGCNLFGGDTPADSDDESGAADQTPTATATPTSLPLAPTLAGDTEESATPDSAEEDDADDEGSRAPTPLPDPTQISVASPTPVPEDGAEGEGEDTGSAATPDPDVTGTAITISPQIGAPRDVIVVRGQQFEPNTTVTLHWEPTCQAPTTAPYWELEAGDNGAFEVGLIVLPAERWPNQPLVAEESFIWLVARSTFGDGLYRCAQYVYLPRTISTSLVQTYTNDDYGYQIQVPDGWTWGWIEDDTTDVRFQSPGGGGGGFVRVESGQSVSVYVASVMSQEFPGASYTTRATSSGAYPGTEAELSNGRIVQFIGANGNTYIFSFIYATGDPASNIHASFTLTE